jgi:hypothetical protein
VLIIQSTDPFKLARAAVLSLAALALAAQFLRHGRYPRINFLCDRAAAVAVGLLAVSYVGITATLWVNHLDFPLSLEPMEGTILQHFQRAVSFAPVYPEPSPEFVPLAYNPLYYYLAAPFAQVFGVRLFTLRLVSVLGAAGAGLIIFLIVRRRTGRAGWGLAALGMYAAAYAATDFYLDTAHADSWLLLTALLGSDLIDRRARWQGWCGLLLLIVAFWVKQHGAFFAVGGVLYLTWREGVRRAIVYWLTAAALGPVLYFLGGPSLFGPRFLYFTWEVPRRWTELSGDAVVRYVRFIARNYLLLAGLGAASVWLTAVRERLKTLNVWQVQLGGALLAGFLGALDPGSSNNVFIPAGAFLIVAGTLGLHEAAARAEWVRARRLHLPVMLMTFALLMYDPRPAFVSPEARRSYADFIGMLKGLDGQVYAPWIGQLGGDYTFHPAAHWVALEDMIRGPQANVESHPNTRRLLAPALEPGGKAYVLTNYPLRNFAWLAFLEDYYVLEADFGERFKPLGALPTRWDNRWPRYLYRYAPGEARGVKSDGQREK